MPFLINGNTMYLRGALTSVVADNPASNLIGGFKNLSSAYRKFRDCLATSEDIQTKVECLIFFFFGANHILFVWFHSLLLKSLCPGLRPFMKGTVLV